MDYVKREDRNIVDDESYKTYLDSMKTYPSESMDHQHTALSMEQLHQLQSSLNAGTIMHNFQLPLSPRQMSTLMLKSNHFSRNYNEIPAHLQRNLELDLVHNLAADLPQNLRHEDLVLTRNLDINLMRSLTNDLDLVQNINDNLVTEVMNQSARNDMQNINHEIDLSHHLNRSLNPQNMLNHERRTPMACIPETQILEQNISQRLDPMQQTLAQRLDQRLLMDNLQLPNQRGDNEHLLPTSFHIKAEQEDDGYFYDNIDQPITNPVNNINAHINHEHIQTNLPQEQIYMYNNHINVPVINNIDLYSRNNYHQNYIQTRDNPQNLVVHKYESTTAFEEKKQVGNHMSKSEGKHEETNENLKPNDQNKIVYQDFKANNHDQKDDVSLDIKGEYICYKCNVVLPTKRLLKQHSKSCTENNIENEKLGKFSCTQCSYRCQAPATLKIHERTHTGEKPFSCNFCDYKSGQKNNVAKHILVHMKEKPFRCQYCDYRCAQKNNLVVHERTHTGYKPFACPFCEYRTVQKPNLVKHMYLHTDQKPFSCDICNYRCVQKTNLTKHKQRHLNEKLGDKIEEKNQVKPYRPRQKSVKCPHCSYKCVQKASLEKHIIFKHSNETGEQGLNLMKVADNVDDSVQNLTVKRESEFVRTSQEIEKES